MKLSNLRRPAFPAPTFTLGLGLLACALARPAIAADSYTFTRIEIPNAVEVYAQGINNQGDTVGNYVNAAGQITGWIRSRNGTTTYHNYGVPGSTEVNGITDNGVAFGTYLGTDDIGHGFTLERGTRTNLDVPGAAATVPIGISNSGFVSGVVVDSGGGVHGFTRQGGVFATFDYPAPGVEMTLLFSTNDHRQVVGAYFDAVGGHGFLKTGNTLSPVNFPGAAYTQPAGINNRGDIVGHYQTTPGLPAFMFEHGLLVRNGVYLTLDYPGATATRLFDINDAGDIIGSALDATGKSFGFIATLNKSGPKK